ncbi:MAG: DUF296 domain-containing protein [Ferroplasma sp.]
MQSNIENNIIAIKLDAGEHVISTLDQVVDKYKVKSGFINMGIGMVKNLKIGYWNVDKYEEEYIEPRSELVAFHGSIAEGDHRFHIHIGVAKNDHKLYGGHFFDGIADPLMEIEIVKFDKINFTREYNNASTLYELKI